MSTERHLVSRMDKVAREVESLLLDMEMLRDDLRQAIADSRVSKNEEKVRDLEALSASLGRAYEALKAFYKQLGLTRLKYS